MTRKPKNGDKVVFKYLKKDFNGRLHCDTGPAVEAWSEDENDRVDLIEEVNYCKIYSWHGTTIFHGQFAKERGLPEDIADRIFHKPETLTADYIDGIDNIEVRRAALERMGVDRYMQDSKNLKIHHEDIDGEGRKRQLISKQLANDATIMGVLVTNSTPNGRYEAIKESWVKLKDYPEERQKILYRDYKDTEDLKLIDGEWQLRQFEESGKFIEDKDENGNLVYKQYFLQVHPELRPMYATGQYDSEGNEIMELGEPQELNCHNAVASTFGLYGEEYILDVES